MLFMLCDMIRFQLRFLPLCLVCVTYIFWLKFSRYSLFFIDLFCQLYYNFFGFEQK